MKKLLDTDPITGIRHVFNYDETTDEAVITAEQDVSSIIVKIVLGYYLNFMKK